MVAAGAVSLNDFNLLASNFGQSAAFAGRGPSSGGSDANEKARGLLDELD